MKKLIVTLIFILISISPAYAETLDVNITNVPDVNITNMIPIAPNSPQNVTVTGISDTQANVSWEASAGATQYMIYVDGYQVMGSNSPGVTLDGLLPNSIHDVYIVANNSGGNSPSSTPVQFETLPVAPTDPEVPLIKHILIDSVSLTWASLPENQKVKSYRIYLDGMILQDVEPESEGFQTVTLSDLEVGDHTVNISGVNDNKEGPMSKTISFSISSLEPPVDLNMYNHSTDVIWLKWLPVDGAQNYIISIDDQIIGKTSESIYIIEKLSPDRSYNIEVIAESDQGNRSLPASKQLKTLPNPEPLNPTSLAKSINDYVPSFSQYIQAVFVVVGFLLLARQLKMSF